MSSSTTWKIALGSSPKTSGNKVVMKELEERLKGRQTTDLKLSDLSKVSPVNERRESKTMTEKQLINVNMLQARARWVTQKDDTTEIGTTGKEGGANDKKDFVQSCEATRRFCLDVNDKPEVKSRPKRTYSTSFPNTSQKVIPTPPKNRPPMLEKRAQPSGKDDLLTGAADNSPQASRQIGKSKQYSGSKAVKKLFGFKIGKGKNAKHTTNNSSGPKSSHVTIRPKKIGIKKALSENILIQQQISNPSTTEDALDDSILSSRSYQNVFDDPSISPKFPQQSRSNTNSPTDFTSRKPKPLPRNLANARSSSLGSSNDQDSDVETPPPATHPFSPLVTSPVQMSSPNSADSNSSTPVPTTPTPRVLKSPIGLELSDVGEELDFEDWELGDGRSEDDELTSSVSSDCASKQALGKAASLNPVVPEWDQIARKKLRRAVCSDGDQEELGDDYIEMDSVCLADVHLMEAGVTTRRFSSSQGMSVPTNSGIFRGPVGGQALNVTVEHANRNYGGGFLHSSGSINDTEELKAMTTSGYQGLNIPTDAKRLSSYYMKIITSEASPNALHVRSQVTGASSDKDEKEEEEVEEVEFYGEVRKEEAVCLSTPASKRLLNKQITMPLLNLSTADDENPNSDFVTVSLPVHSINPRAVKSASPPKLHPAQDSPVTERASNGSTPRRKIQYTPVTIEASTKKRTPSVPKKFKYQTVTLSSEAGNKSAVEEPANTNKATTPKQAEMFEISDRQDSDAEMPLFPKGEHPLLKLSSSSSVARHDGLGERSYYVNRKSLIALESCKDLPTTMLSTVDEVTGKVIWHEYVEIDEDQIDKMANSAGVAKWKPIPEKLGMLLGVPVSDKGSPGHDIEAPKIEEERPLSNSEGIPCDEDDNDDDTNQSLNSSMSSECNYIFNLNDPPSVPPRPENLDALVDQLKNRTSDDYSYAVVPEKFFFGKHWMMFKAKKPGISHGTNGPSAVLDSHKDNSKENGAEQKFAAASVASKSTKKNVKLSPPSVPPKSNSLLREQMLATSQAEGSPEPYLMPIIMKTKRKIPLLHKSAEKPGKEKTNSPTFVSYIREQASLKLCKDPDSQWTPPKPIPYEEHQKMKHKQHVTGPKFAGPTVGTRHQDSLLLSKAINKTHGNKMNRARGRPKPHKKLARQKTYRGSSKTHHQRSHQRRSNHLTPPDMIALNGKVLQGGVQKRRKPRGARPELTEKLKRQSLANIMHSQALTEQTSLNKLGSETSESKETSDERLNSTEHQRVSRGLGEILVEISTLLQNNQCSESDLLLAVENHFKLNLKMENLTQAIEEDQVSTTKGSDTDSAEKGAVAEDGQGRITDRDSSNASKDKECSGEGVKDVAKAKSTKPKPSYVNLMFDDDDEAGKLDQPIVYKPPYVNLEFSEEEPDSNDLSDELLYIYPSEYLASSNRVQATADSPTKKTFYPSSTPIICIDDGDGKEICPITSRPHILRSSMSPPEKATKSPAPTPRIRSHSSIIDSSYKQQLSSILQQRRHDRTLSNPSDTDQVPSMPDKQVIEESNLDFSSSRTREQAHPKEPPANKQNRPLKSGASMSVLTVSEGTANTLSYNLALEMEDRKFSKSVEVAASCKTTRLAEVREEDKDHDYKRKRKCKN